MTTTIRAREHVRPAIDAVVRAHPVGVATAFAVAVATLHALWIWAHRRIGAFDADEAGYLANAAELATAARSGPGAVVSQVSGMGTAPLVPLLSAPLQLTSPSDPRLALLVQPLLLVAAAGAIAGLCRRLVGPWPTVVAAAAFVVFPTTIYATQTYQYGLAVTAAAGGALLSVMASRRGHGRWIWAFGPLVAVMVTSRTMAIALAPAVVLAAATVIGRDRRGLGRLAVSTAVGVVLSLPWYIAARGPVFDYLLQYGYGARADAYGSASPLGRPLDLLSDVVLSGGVLLPLLGMTAAAVVLGRSVRSVGVAGTFRRLCDAREWAGLIVFAAVAAAALLSSSNLGTWFTLPLWCALLPLGAAALTRAGSRWAHLAAGVVVVQGTLLLLSGLWVLPGPLGDVVPGPILPSYHEVALSSQDGRFDSGRRKDQRRAADEWRAAQARILDAVPGGGRGIPVITVVGNTPLLNGNSLALLGSPDGNSVVIEQPDTAGELTSWVGYLDAMGRDVEGRPAPRTIIVVDDPSHAFPADAGAARMRAEALARGWVVAEVVTLPNGARAEALTPG